MYGNKYNLISIVYMATRIHFTAEILNSDNIIINLENEKIIFMMAYITIALLKKKIFLMKILLKIE